MYNRHIPSFEKSLKYYQNESGRFLYDNGTVNRNKTFKVVARVNALRFNLQLNDIQASLYNELKTFLLVNTRLYRYHKTIKKYLPITELGIRKRAFIPGWFKYKDLLYHSTHNMLYRTIAINVKDKQLLIPAFIRKVRPLNKELMYKISTTSFIIEIPSPFYIVKKRRPRSLFSMLYLGFKFRGHMKRKKRGFKSFYKKIMSKHPRQPKRLRRRKFRQSKLKRRRRFSFNYRLHGKLKKRKLTKKFRKIRIKRKGFKRISRMIHPFKIKKLRLQKSNPQKLRGSFLGKYKQFRKNTR